MKKRKKCRILSIYLPIYLPTFPFIHPSLSLSLSVSVVLIDDDSCIYSELCPSAQNFSKKEFPILAGRNSRCIPLSYSRGSRGRLICDVVSNHLRLKDKVQRSQGEDLFDHPQQGRD